MQNNIRSYINKLNYYTKLYDEGHPEISNKNWDDMYFDLKQQEEITHIIYPDSPTQSIQYKVVSELDKIEHEHQMLSLNKTKDVKEIEKFFNRRPFVGMFKLDGLTCSLTYENGKLIRAETRGNGQIGEDILHNAKVIKNIPQTIEYKERLVVDGEIICKKPDFKQFENEYKNPRNFAAGSIRLLSSEECATRNLSFIAWEMIEGYPDITLFDIRLSELFKLGFETVPALPPSDNIEANIIFLDQLVQHDIYPIDGYVFKFNDIKYGNKQGQTSHHLNNAIALKRYDELYDTRLKTIKWTMGRTGVLTPVAIFEPIEIDGATIEQASLHNVSIMKELLGDCAYVGEPLKIFKANQIIPQIAEAGPKYNYGYVIAHAGVSANDNPEFCPICHKEIEYITSKDGIVNAYCSNPQCEGKLINILDHFFGKKGLDVKGVSKATFEKLIDWGWINSIEDVFYLNKYRKDWIKKPGFGVTSVDKILNSIEKGKQTSLEKFLSAIGIPLIGQTVAKDLTKIFKTYKEFRNAVKDEEYNFSILDNFGYEMNNSIKNYNYDEADRIADLLTFETTNENIKNNILDGQIIVITGKLNKFKNRNELKDIIEKHGGKVTGSISSKTNILINNDINSNSSKNKQAKDRNIPILSEEEFIQEYLQS